MTIRLSNIILFLIILSAKISYCQEDSMMVEYTGDCPEFLLDSDSLLSTDDLSLRLFEKGYPYASFDSNVMTNGLHKKYIVGCGPRINYVDIVWKDPQSAFPDQIKRKIVPWKDVVSQRNDILNELVNKGYPYTRLLTHATGLMDDTLQLEFSLDTIRRIYIQEVDIEGRFSMNAALFEKMTGISAGQAFSVDRINRSKQIIQLWDFAQLRKLEYDFNPYSVSLTYFMEPNVPSRFDMLIGLVPSNRVNKKYEITGNAYLDIRNQLKMAERIYLKFDKYANSSQSIDLRFDFPYLPLLRSGILAEGLIDRRDSTVLDVHGRLGLQYQWRPGLKYAFFLQRDQSRLITINSQRLIGIGRLPAGLDYNYSAAGFSLSNHALDNTVNPRKGKVVRVTITGGLKKLIRNGQIQALELPADQTSFSTQYDSLTQSTIKSELDVSWDHFFPIRDYSTLRLRALAGWTWSSEDLYENEQRRLGGFQDFRGFPEKSFRGDTYTVLTAEYRFLFGSESNAYVFSDFGFIHQQRSMVSWNYPYSIGIGLNLGTKAGVFGISYSVGGQRGIPLSLDQSRVNFGLMVNY